MNKVVIERTRYGGKGGRRRTYEKVSRVRDKDFLDCGVEDDFRPRKESMRKKHFVNGDPKYFSDLLGPLEGYLSSQVGQPWDDVWSDICKVLKGNSLQAAHIKGHVKQMVGGIPHSGETYFDDKDWFSPRGYYQPVYVNEDGILCKGKESYPKAKKTVYHYYRESDTVEYHKLNGCWFRVEIGSEEREHRYLNGYSKTYYTRRYTHYYVASKKALSKKEIKKLGLSKKTETVAPKLTLEE
jgi:hypothetical protein